MIIAKGISTAFPPRVRLRLFPFFPILSVNPLIIRAQLCSQIRITLRSRRMSGSVLAGRCSFPLLLIFIRQSFDPPSSNLQSEPSLAVSTSQGHYRPPVGSVIVTILPVSFREIRNQGSERVERRDDDN
jgi:hypothetical protein